MSRLLMQEAILRDQDNLDNREKQDSGNIALPQLACLYNPSDMEQGSFNACPLDHFRQVREPRFSVVLGL